MVKRQVSNKRIVVGRVANKYIKGGMSKSRAWRFAWADVNKKPIKGSAQSHY